MNRRMSVTNFQGAKVPNWSWLRALSSRLGRARYHPMYNEKSRLRQSTRIGRHYFPRSACMTESFDVYFPKWLWVYLAKAFTRTWNAFYCQVCRNFSSRFPCVLQKQLVLLFSLTNWDYFIADGVITANISFLRLVWHCWYWTHRTDWP